jgi:hypothetical protein
VPAQPPAWIGPSFLQMLIKRVHGVGVPKGICSAYLVSKGDLDGLNCRHPGMLYGCSKQHSCSTTLSRPLHESTAGRIPADWREAKHLRVPVSGSGKCCTSNFPTHFGPFSRSLRGSTFCCSGMVLPPWLHEPERHQRANPLPRQQYAKHLPRR